MYRFGDFDREEERVAYANSVSDQIDSLKKEIDQVKDTLRAALAKAAKKKEATQ